MAAAAILGAVVTGAGELVDLVGLDSSNSPYRPSYWSSGVVTSITVPGLTSSVGTSQTTTDGSQVAGSVATTTQSDPPTVYVFDGIGRRQHNHHARTIKNPTQTGSSVVDQIVIDPRTLVLEIWQSDIMDSYTPGQWAGSRTKSISTFEILDQIQLQRSLLTVTTRLHTYQNMVLTDIAVIDDYKTQFGLVAIVTFEQIIIGSIDTNADVSARPQLTNSTSQGQTGVSAVPASVTTNNTVAAGTSNGTNVSTPPGAGTYSSNPVN